MAKCIKKYCHSLVGQHCRRTHKSLSGIVSMLVSSLHQSQLSVIILNLCTFIVGFPLKASWCNQNNKGKQEKLKHLSDICQRDSHYRIKGSKRLTSFVMKILFTWKPLFPHYLQIIIKWKSGEICGEFPSSFLYAFINEAAFCLNEYIHLWGCSSSSTMKRRDVIVICSIIWSPFCPLACHLVLDELMANNATAWSTAG